MKSARAKRGVPPNSFQMYSGSFEQGAKMRSVRSSTRPNQRRGSEKEDGCISKELQGKEKEMDSALKRSAKLAKQNLKTNPAFKKLRRMASVGKF